MSFSLEMLCFGADVTLGTRSLHFFQTVIAALRPGRVMIHLHLFNAEKFRASNAAPIVSLPAFLATAVVVRTKKKFCTIVPHVTRRVLVFPGLLPQLRAFLVAMASAPQLVFPLSVPSREP